MEANIRRVPDKVDPILTRGGESTEDTTPPTLPYLVKVSIKYQIGLMNRNYTACPNKNAGSEK